jgi:hypothetical protein
MSISPKNNLPDTDEHTKKYSGEEMLDVYAPSRLGRVSLLRCDPAGGDVTDPARHPARHSDGAP